MKLPSQAVFHVEQSCALDRDLNPVVRLTRTMRLEPRTFARAFMQLGRYGDLCIVLRPLKLIADWTGRKPVLLVSHEFVNFLEGVSYVEPVSLPYHWFAGMPQARYTATKWFGDQYRVLQCNGVDWAASQAVGTSYQRAMWGRTNVPVEFCEAAPLVIDRRSPEREEILRARYRSGKPLLLYNFAGFTSPFRAGAQVEGELKRYGKSYELVNLAQLKAVRVYDLLGLYDVAALLVTSDTVTLHLASASKVKMVAYTAPFDGASTPYPANTLLEIKYAHAEKRLPELRKILEAHA